MTFSACLVRKVGLCLRLPKFSRYSYNPIAQAQDEAELRQPIMAKVGEYFAAKRWGLSFLDQFPAIDENTPGMIKLALSLDHNPLLRYLVQRHAAVHDEVILPPRVWQTICPRADHGHVMLGPVVSSGQLVGGIAFTRHRDDLAFKCPMSTSFCAAGSVALKPCCLWIKLRSPDSARSSNC